jgi:hypothetical protein
MTAPPLFILGTERSGSNLLRVILGSHPSIVIPHPPHVMKYFTPLAAKYGDLSDPARLLRLIQDVRRLVCAHIQPWPWVPEVAEIVERVGRRPGPSGPPDLFSVYAAFHDAVRDHEHKRRWGCKSTFMIAHGERIIAEWPDAKLLWLYRDPRDVAASSRESVFSAFHPANTAALWKEQQDQGLALESAGVPLLRVKYEALIGDAEGEVRRICAYLGEEFHPPMLEFFKGAEARKSASLSESWKNTAAPIRTEGLERWRGDLSPTEVLALESIAGPTMEALGYAPVNTPEARAAFHPGAVQRAGWWIEDEAAWLKVEARSFRRDKNFWKRWSRSVLLTRIRSRLVLGV